MACTTQDTVPVFEGGRSQGDLAAKGLRELVPNSQKLFKQYSLPFRKYPSFALHCSLTNETVPY